MTRQTYNDLWRTVPAPDKDEDDADEDERGRRRCKRGKLGLPEENLLYFIEKRAPRLEDWQRELLRIVRNVSQYFYPQKQTQMMNEGCATFVHYEIMNRLHDRGLITEGSMLEFLHSHSSVVFQPDFDDPRFSGLNPYALGFAMMSDIQRICDEPTEEDREWFPDIAGNGDALRRAAPRLGQLPRRELHPAVSEPGDDPQVPAVPDRRRQQQAGAAGRGDPRRARLSQDPQRAVAAIRSVAARARHPGRRCRPDAATAAWSWRITSMTACCSTKRAAARCCATPRTLWGYSVKLLEIEAATDKTLKTYESAPEAK